jgi:hypothetical protein
LAVPAFATVAVAQVPWSLNVYNKRIELHWKPRRFISAGFSFWDKYRGASACDRCYPESRGHTEKRPAAGLANGIYIGKLSAGNRVKYVKIIISK